MILQNPSILWGLLLLVIPIIIHLFDFRRIKHIKFSNVAFLQTVQKQNIPKKRLKSLLILLSRLLVLTCIILAFGRPSLPNKDLNFSVRDHLLVIDNSGSMATKCQGISCLEMAKVISMEIVKSYGHGHFYSPGMNGIKQFISQDEFAQQLSRLTFGKEKFELRFDKDVLVKNRVTVLSDFQPEIIAKIEELVADSIPMLLVPITPGAKQNLYVDSVFLKNPFSIGDNKRILGVKIVNSGTIKTASALVRVYNDLSQLSSVAVAIDANASKTVFFEIENSPNPIYHVSVEDYEVNFDNDYFFTLPSFERIKIAVLGGEKSRVIEAIFTNKTYFDLVIYSEASINFERFFSSDLVIIHSFDQLPEWLDVDRLSGDLVVIPTADLDINNYTNRLGFSISQAEDSTFSQLKTAGFKHPFFEDIFEDIDPKTSFPKVKSLYKVAGGNDVLLHADAPYLQRFERGNKMYWFNGPLNYSYSELQNHALFLPIMYRIAEAAKDLNKSLTHTLSNIPLQVNTERMSTKLLELKGDNTQFIPSFHFNQSTLMITLPLELHNPGFYYLTTGADTLQVIALNVNRKESVLDGMTGKELKEHFKSYAYVDVLSFDSSVSLSETLSELTTRTELWKYVLLLALLFLVAETVLHRWLK